jgi:outer membrane receptor protein involved in Fe transport
MTLLYKRLFNCLCLLMLGIGSLSAQKRGVYFIDSLTRSPIANVEVWDIENNLHSTSDALGYVHLVAPEKGILHISCLGFATKKLRLSDLTDPFIALVPVVAQLSEVTINGAQQPTELNRLAQLDLHLRPVQNAQDVLRVVPGLFIGQHAGGGKAEQIFLRGFDIDHGTDVAITADGIPVNMVSHAHGQGYADLHFLIPELIEEIDFDKGPYQADKGNFATAGYVALRTQNILESSFVKSEIGQFHTYRTVAAANLFSPVLRQKNQHLYLAVEATRTQGYFENPQDFGRYNAMLKYHAQLGQNHIISASLSGFSSRWNASGQIPERAVKSGQIGYFGAIDANEGGQTRRVNAQMQIISQLANEAVIKNQIYYSKYAFDLFSNFTFFKENRLDGDQIRQREQRHLFGTQHSYEKRTEILGIRGKIEAGIQTRFDLIDDKELSRTKNRNTLLTPIALGDVQEQNLSAYFMQTWTLAPRWELSTGARADHLRFHYRDALAGQTAVASTSLLSPKLHVQYQAGPRAALYLLNGRGFHSNDAQVSTARRGDIVLPPAFGTDLGGMFKLNERFLLQTALWHLHMAQEFVYVGDEGVVEAGSASRRFGLDVSVRYQITRQLFADADFSYAHARTGTDMSEHIPMAPSVTSAGGLVYRRLKGLNASLRYRYMADRAANSDKSLIAKGYCIFDANLQYTTRRWEAGFSVQNLLNSRWIETQFETESQLRNEPAPVTEIHFTPGTSLAGRVFVVWRF